MYEFIDNINIKEYENFVLQNEYSHFMQSYSFGKIKEKKAFIPHYVALKKDSKIVATALLLQKKLVGGYSYFYSPRGFILDYSNKELLKIFTKYIRQYAIKNKAIFVKIDPALKLHDLDTNGIIIGNNNNLELLTYLKKLGYRHLGFNKSFEHEQPRFTYRLSLENKFENIFDNIHSTTKKILNKGNINNLNLYIGNSNDIEDFYSTMICTAEREKIIQSPIEYYKEFYEEFHKNNQSDLYIIKANITEIKNNLEIKINEYKAKINKINNVNKINEYKNQLNKLYKEYNEIEAIKEDTITLSSIITIKYKNTVWTVHGGNNTKLMNLNANYLLYFQIIKDAYDNGYKCVDFFGCSGDINPKPTNPLSGLHNFKKRFGGEYTEFIGEFDLITNKLLYYSYKILIPLYRKIKKLIKR